MDRPILFSAPMVRALLDGRKSQTRRIIKPQPPEGARYAGIHYASYELDSHFFNSPHGPHKVPARIQEGDELWVREAWRPPLDQEGTAPRALKHGSPIEYIAGGIANVPSQTVHFGGRNRPAIHMPRWASRMTLTVTDVRVQRLQDISEEDARAEGAVCTTCANVVAPNDGFPSYRSGFGLIWEAINGAGSWHANPWVAAYTFTVEGRNIDAPPAREASHG